MAAGTPKWGVGMYIQGDLEDFHFSLQIAHTKPVLEDWSVGDMSILNLYSLQECCSNRSGLEIALWPLSKLRNGERSSGSFR